MRACMADQWVCAYVCVSVCVCMHVCVEQVQDEKLDI